MAKTKKTENTFLERVKYEVEFVGLLDKDSDYEGGIGRAVIELAETFSKQGHSGFSASYVGSIFYALIQDKALTPLTNEPEEWEDVSATMYSPEQIAAGQKMWQNKRDLAAFSRDGGKTWENMRDNTKGASVTREEALNGIDTEGTDSSGQESDSTEGADDLPDEKVSTGAAADSRKNEGASKSGVTNGRQSATEPSSKKKDSPGKKSQDVEKGERTVAKPKPTDV